MVKRILFVSAMAILVCANVQAGTVQLPQTGQTTCYDETGGVVGCAGTGQDGDVRAGVKWPEPRFQDNGDGTMTDKLTGLVWAQDTQTPGPTVCDPGGPKTWQESLDHVACLNSESYLGFDDWRLPNINELESLTNPETDTKTWLAGAGFLIAAGQLSTKIYWTSTTYVFNPEVAWFVTFDLFEDASIGLQKSYDQGLAWPVRGTSSGPAKVWQTGQTTCYDSSGASIACAGTGQDGEKKTGAAWPSPRFTVTGDCVTDNLTGLVWVKEPGVKRQTWQGSLDSANTMDLCGASDWRLPNIREMRSLVNNNEADNVAWLKSQGFGNVQAYMHWTSTSAVWPSPMMACTVDTWSGGLFNFPMTKSYGFFAWPVR